MGRPGHNTALGAYGERIAARYLATHGMTVLERNWRCDQGELDLVLRDGDILVLCEVKTRTSDQSGHPLEAVGEAKVERMHRLAALWQEARGVRPADVRLDMVGIVLPRRGSAVIEHVRGIG